MKTYTQLLNEIGIPMMRKALVGRALRTANPKNIKKLPQNVQKLGRTTELIGKKVQSQDRAKTQLAAKPITPSKMGSFKVDKGDVGELVRVAGKGMQAVAGKKL